MQPLTKKSPRKPQSRHRYADDDPPDDAPPPADASQHIAHLERVILQAASDGRKRLSAVLYARISDPRPGQRETTSDQLKAARTAIRRLGKKHGVAVDVIGEFSESVSGWKLSKRERPELARAAKLAKANDAVLVAFDVSRFVRNEDYNLNRSLPTEDDFKQLTKLVGDVRLATITNPKIHEARNRSTIRGLENAKARGVKLGRPKKKSYRKPYTKMPIKHARVIRLRDSGMSWPKIAKSVGKAESTIRGWYKRSVNGQN